MIKMKKLKPALALLLAAVMVLTGPVQSAGLVRAEEITAQESMVLPDEELEGTDGDESPAPQTQETETVLKTQEAEDPKRTELSAETQVAETAAEDASVAETEVLTEMEEGASASTEETAQEETEEAETSQEADELQISGTEMKNAAPLSVGKNEITIRKDETGKWYYFEPKEDGVYYVELAGDLEYECILKKSGVKKSLYEDEYEYERRELFLGKAGERVYFQPCFASWYYRDEEYENEDLSTPAVIEVRAAEKGSLSKDSDGNYTLAYTSNQNKMEISLAVNATNTTISCDAKNRNQTDDRYYALYAYCKSETYGRSSQGHVLGNAGGVDFIELDMDETYHIDYTLLDADIFVWFGGIDVTTKDTDKVGGVITNTTAGFSQVAIDYELFFMDTAGRDAWIRYKKDGEEEWNYQDIYRDSNSTMIRCLNMETRYIIELVDYDKKTVYDSRQVTTKKYEGKVTARVNTDSIKSESVGIDITGYDTNMDMLSVYAWYRDVSGQKREIYSSYWDEEKLQSGTVTLQLSGLTAGTEYKDVKISVYDRDRYDSNATELYAGTVSFTTKESPIDIRITPASIGRTLQIDAVVEGLSEGEDFRFDCSYRQKGDLGWSYIESGLIRSSSNTLSLQKEGLEEADYEIKIDIISDYGYILYQTKTVSYHFTPQAFTGDVKANAKVTKSYVNALEIETTLIGAPADSSDVYTCRFERSYGSDWGFISEITLDPKKPVTQKIYSNTSQQWRYRIYRNDEECYRGYLDRSETQTKPLELDILSMEWEEDYLRVSCRVKNWSEVLKYEEDEEDASYAYELDAYLLFRKKGVEKWMTITDGSLYFRFDKEGTAESKSYIFYNDNYGGLKLDPLAQYEVCLTDGMEDDDSIVYAQTTFTPTASWEIPEENNFVYSSTNTRRSIPISDNYNKPTAEVENENIVSIREIRQSRVYLDVHNVGSTTLDVTADGITKTVTVTVSPSAETLFFFEGADKTLADLKLPANFAWVDPSISPKADDENKLQYFDVTINESDGTKYGKVPVAVSTLEADGITIEGNDTIGFGKDSVYGAYHTGKGYVENIYAEAQAYEITHEWKTEDDGLVIKAGAKERNVTVTGVAAGEHELTLTITVRNFQTGNTLTREKTQKIRVIKEGLIDNLVIRPAKEQPADAIPQMEIGDTVCGYMVTGSVVSGQVIEINCEYLDLSSQNKIKLEVKTDKGSKDENGQPVLDDVSVSWANASEDILAVSEDGLVTIKGKGEGILHVTADDEEHYSVPVIFRIHDNSPVFNCTEYEIGISCGDGIRLSYVEPFHNWITGMTLEGTDKFEVRRPRGETCWYLYKKDNTEAATYQMTLKITAGDENTYVQPITVTVLPDPEITVSADADAATVLFSQTAIPNLFYVNSEAVFSVTDLQKEYEIEDIRTIEKDKDAQNFHVKSYDAATGTLTLTANKLDSASLANYTAKKSQNTVANVEVKFKGYDGYYPKDGSGISFAVAVSNKPISALKAEDAFVTGSINTAQVDVLEKKTVVDLSGCSLEPVAKKTKADGLTAAVENGGLKLTHTGTKSGKYTFNVTNPNWTKTLTLTGKISKVDVKKLAVKASKTKAVLNTKYNDSVKINLSVKGNASFPVVFTTEVKPATDALAVTAAGDNKSITIRAAEGKQLTSGKYTIIVTGKIGEETTKAAKITITATDKEPEVKLSAKGSINILNRDFSGITYTASIKNTDAEIKTVELAGADANIYNTFKVVKNDGKRITLRALRTAESINTKQPYVMKVKLTLSNGAVIKDGKGVTLKVKPVDKLPKIKVNVPKKPTISKAKKNGVTVRAGMEAGFRIEKVELDGKDKDKFIVEQNGQDVFTIRLAENAGAVDAKAYSVKYKLYFSGANATTKQAVKSIKITVSE